MGKGRKGGGRKKRPAAKTADRHVLYQLAVQAPDTDIAFFDRVYRRHRGGKPLSLREDFCGTALLAREWAASDPRRTALAVDLDAATLEWGRRHNLGSAAGDVARRVRLIEADVREVRKPKVDLACAMNFSFCIFKQRHELRSYFESVYRGLESHGLFVLELFGGTEAIGTIEESREVEDFVYVWEQARFNPITNEGLCHIHFRFPDGSRLKRAFSYEWRLWSIPELRELLTEVGFATTEVYWEAVGDDGDGTGEYRRTEEEENQEGWMVYVVAVR